MLQCAQNDKQKLHNKMADSESDDEIVIIGFVLTSLLSDHAKKRKRKRNIWVREWVGKRQCSGAFNGLIGELEISDIAGYKNFLRMDAMTFEKLTTMLAPLIQRRDTRLRQAIPVEERLAVTLRYLATGRLSYICHSSYFSHRLS